jgi:hypothetical protein
MFGIRPVRSSFSFPFFRSSPDPSRGFFLEGQQAVTRITEMVAYKTVVAYLVTRMERGHGDTDSLLCNAIDPILAVRLGCPTVMPLG